jgi:hypothetical protein
MLPQDLDDPLFGEPASLHLRSLSRGPDSSCPWRRSKGYVRNWKAGEAGSRGFARLSRELEAANARLAAFSPRVRVAAAAAVAAATAAGVAMIRSGLQTVDAQAKLAQSLGTTVASIQTLERAGELAGVSMSGIEQATKDLTRRLIQATAGSSPAADALDRLGLSANELIALPLDQRV